MCVHTYLKDHRLLVPGEVNIVGLSIGHVPVLYINIIGLPGAAQVVPNL